MNIVDIVNQDDPSLGISFLLEKLYLEGGEKAVTLEQLAYFKKFHPKTFESVEEQVLSALGLFYKIEEPSSLYSFMLMGFGKQYQKDFGRFLTPIQANIRSAVESNDVVSISAPTSAGKSYSIRDFIAEQDGDAVVIVPSRALIAEYVNTMRRRFKGNKNIMVSSFVDNVFTSRKLRRIFILTPERARELFSPDLTLDINVFFFDEAQMSEERERGVIFDVAIRRIKKKFPSAKLIFAHPFVENPEAQLKKHGFDIQNNFSRAYTHGSVGKLCVFKHQNKKCYYFSPFAKKGHQVRECIEFPGKFEDFAFDGKHSVLIYVSKASIYNGSAIEDFRKYIDRFPQVEDKAALEIIERIEHLLGTDETHESRLVSLLYKGVVIHHGSVPLDVRFLIEDYIRGGYAKICFATSTLAQGVNMPFDIVWLDNMRFLGDGEGVRALAFKNLIGRAGRLSEDCKFDTGFIYTKNARSFSEKLNIKYELSSESVIDAPLEEIDPDSREVIESIQSETFDDDKQVPMSRVERLSKPEILELLETVLELLFKPSDSIKDNIAGKENRLKRFELTRCMRLIYEAALNRELFIGEKAVFDTAISLFLQVIQGRSFREIVATRYHRVSKRDKGKIGAAEFSQSAEKLPNSKLVNAFSLFKKGFPARAVSYDAIIFDTYDYLDQVISFSLTDTFVAALKIYNEKFDSLKASKMVELFTYGTNDRVHTLLIRYGFPPECITELIPYVDSISEEDIKFNEQITDSPRYLQELVSWYLP
ncbi:DEAD/DEAH box helicase [Aliikangiella sp. IMCC44359]|uniref:DEAD/DEAH box helicase n=1 Tax=Aliikangiella sp. IMCC44359 TaxID=3459125 RepID=UPI00403A886F